MLVDGILRVHLTALASFLQPPSSQNLVLSLPNMPYVPIPLEDDMPCHTLIGKEMYQLGL